MQCAASPPELATSGKVSPLQLVASKRGVSPVDGCAAGKYSLFTAAG